MDLTGTWEGKGTCKGLTTGGAPYKLVVKDSIFKITQTSASDINLQGEDFTGTYPYNGLVIESAAKPRSGQVSAIHCASNPFIPDFYNDMLIGKAKVKPTTDNPAGATLKLTGIFFNGDTLATCKSKYTRVSTADPGIGPCIPPE
jgi:hypothetical protein